MLNREEWERIREVRPRTPFESKLARPNARIRTDEPVHLVGYTFVYTWPNFCFLIFWILEYEAKDLTECH